MKKQLLPLVLLAALLLPSPLPAEPTTGVDPLDLRLVGTNVFALAVQPDGKIILGGAFTAVLGVARNNLARLNADGTLDLGFDPNVNGGVDCVVVQPDGKVLLGGSFTAVRPNGAPVATPRNRIARVFADGSLDAVFNPNANDEVTCLALQSDGRILVGGVFQRLQPPPTFTPVFRDGFARLFADGTLDTAFNPPVGGFVRSVVLQPDGKILVGGNYVGSSYHAQHVVRVNPDGTQDTSFDPAPDDDLGFGLVSCIAVQPDGKILLGGSFTKLQPNGAATPTPRGNIARVNPDGTLDLAFDPNASLDVLSFALQTDGKVLLSGAFTTLRPNGAPTKTVRNRIARVNADGSVDAGFDPNVISLVSGLALQADGKVLISGKFTALKPAGAPTFVFRNRFARLYNDSAAQMLSARGRKRVLWQRGGAAQEVLRVTFELSTDDGATWRLLGAGKRIGTTPNWTLKVAAGLPKKGLLRARGLTVSGGYDGSSGFVESVAPIQ